MSSTPPPSPLDELQKRFSELLRSGPAADIERNVKALLAQAFQRADLVTREEFDTQVARVEQLERRLEALERRVAAAQPDSRGG